MLTVTVEDLGKNVILHCAGRLVRGEEEAILCAAVRHRERDIAVDLLRVEGIDGAGLGALISLQAAGIYLRLRNPGKAVSEILRVAHLDSIFEIEPTQTPAEKTSMSLESAAMAV